MITEENNVSVGAIGGFTWEDYRKDKEVASLINIAVECGAKKDMELFKLIINHVYQMK